MYQDLTIGNQMTNLTSYVPWGLWVASYIYFIGISAGAFLLSSLLYGFGVKRLEPIGKFALYTAIVTLVMALLTIWSDIGHPFRAIEIFTRPQFHSMMAWMVWLYTAYFILLISELVFAIRTSVPSSNSRGIVASLLGLKGNQSPKVLSRDRKILRGLAIIGIPLAVAFHGGVGALFATVASQEIWHNPLYPILFLVGALFSGGALLTGLVAFIWPRKDGEWLDLVKYLGSITLALLLSYALLEWSEYSVPLWYGVGDTREMGSLHVILFGQFWYVFWIFHVLLGLAVPAVLLFWMRQRPKVIGFASMLAAVMFMAVRLNIVIPAYVEPQLQGLPTAFLGSRLSYTYIPNLFEWQLVAFVVALGIGLLYLGYRYLPLFDGVEVRMYE
jgi:molybdopterin-containing oxidoreductase family membrane subunit